MKRVDAAMPKKPPILFRAASALVTSALALSAPPRPWTVLASRRVSGIGSSRTFSIRLAPDGEGEDAYVFDYKPGQFVLVSFPGRGILSEPRPFSIASAPTEGRFIEIFAKDTGDWSGAAKNIAEAVDSGNRIAAEVRGPFGKFSYLEAPGAGRFVFLAGGIGGAPLISMVRFMAHSDRTRKALLLWGARTRDELFALDELADAGSRISRFSFVPILSHDPRWTGETGRIDREKLERLVPAFFGTSKDGFEWNSASYRICGPGSFNADMRKALKDLGVGGAAIHEQRFSL